jgi:integrase
MGPRRLSPEELRLAAAAKAPLTLVGYASDWRLWTAWCKATGRDPLPAPPETLCEYVIATLNRGCKATTVMRHLTSIAHYHLAEGYESPVRSQAVNLLRGARRIRVEQPRQRAPLLLEHLRSIARVINGSSPAHIRTRAVLLFGWATALRQSNIVALDLTDIERTDRGVVVLIRREKTDQEGRGRRIGVPLGRHPETCPVRALEAWLACRGPEPGPVFRRLNRWGRITSYGIGPPVIAQIVKQAVAAIGLDPRRFGGHSLRSGLITEAVLGGATETQVMAHSGHRSTQVMRRYFRNADPFRGNVCAGIDL